MRRQHVLGVLVTALLVASSAFIGRNSVEAPAYAAERRVGEAGSGEDVLPALLAEVKGLRAAMEQMAAAGPRAQLFISRLQLQEGRIAGMVRRLDTVRDSLVTAQREYDQIRGSLRMLESDKSSSQPSQDGEGVLPGLKVQVAAAKANVTRLTAEEAQLTGDLAAEQARWVELNQRLDELERSLARR
jgi:hypothetical protein